MGLCWQQLLWAFPSSVSCLSAVIQACRAFFGSSAPLHMLRTAGFSIASQACRRLLDVLTAAGRGGSSCE